MQVDFQSEKYNKLSKILVIVFMALTFSSTLMPDEFVLGIRELHFERRNRRNGKRKRN